MSSAASRVVTNSPGHLAPPPTRPSLNPRIDTSTLLEYYASADADARKSNSHSPDLSQSERSPVKPMSAKPLSSPSEYSPDDEERIVGRVRRRPSIPSAKGGDRRRMHVVDISNDDLIPTTKTSSSSHFDGLSIVAPPDVSSSSFSTPPSLTPSSEPPTPDLQQHKRKNSRSITILGTEAEIPDGEKTAVMSSKTPVFQYPQGISPAVKSADGDDYLSVLSSGSGNSALTPDIGEGKSVHKPVAAPIVTPVSTLMASRQKSQHSREPSTHAPPSAYTAASLKPVQPVPVENPYLHYQIGQHATAGPLPPPPRAAFAFDVSATPPRRPPRIQNPPSSARKSDGEPLSATSPQILSVPRSIITPASPQTPNEVIDLNATEQRLSSDRKLSPPATSTSHHRREGAHPPSSDTEVISHSDTVLSSSSEILSPNANLQRDSFDSPRTSFDIQSDASNGSYATPEEIIKKKKRRSMEVAGKLRRSLSRSPKKAVTEVTEDGILSSSPSKASVLKRFSSLPKRPSASPRESLTGARTPSPLLDVAPTPPPMSEKPAFPLPMLPHQHQSFSLPTERRLRPPVRKTVCIWPDAMVYSDILKMKTSAERAKAYAIKINEFYLSDSGVGEFMSKLNAMHHTKSSRRGTLMPGPRLPSEGIPAHQYRESSRGSMVSEFPLRGDSFTATDLSVRPIDEAPMPPPVLPYPALAQTPTRAKTALPVLTTTPTGSTSRPALLSSPSTTSNKGSFFSSMGRKTSVRKGPTSPSGAKFPPISAPVPERPRTTVTTASSVPTIPGGPRAPPSAHRSNRSQTTFPIPKLVDSPPPRKSSLALEEPHPVAKVQNVTVTAEEAEFAEQVEKLRDLLPHADRETLASYLQLAGSEVLAIGLYLEDERNGTIRS